MPSTQEGAMQPSNDTAGTLVIGALGAVGIAAAAVAIAGAASPPLAALAAAAIAAQWIAFVPAYLRQTERFYDLVGSATYLSTIAAAVAIASPGARGSVVAALVVVWAARLGAFLVRRVHASGGDGRFDAIKPRPIRFLIAWTLQGLWVVLTSLAAWLVVTDPDPPPLQWTDGVGLALWIAGFVLEVVADRQKSSFRARGASGWIDEGVWRWSRHPNYLGEIVLWTGIVVVGAGVFDGREWLGLISPAFVTLLLLRVSGVPLLEARADAKWGGDPAYEAYKRRVPRLLPTPFRHGAGGSATPS
jgi:steroid 5-alpha reductase family enzyme